MTFGTDLVVPDLLPGTGALDEARRRGLKGWWQRSGTRFIRPGRRSSAWIKDKFWNTQEVVIGGWREGEGGRKSGIGALLVGVPADYGLQFVGRVGTGFTDTMLGELRETLNSFETTNHRSMHHFPRWTAKA